VKRWLDFEREVKEDGIGAGRLAGTIATRNDRRTRKGTPMAILTLSDTTGSFECIAFSEQISQYSDVLKVGESVILSVEADDRPDGIGLRLISAQPIGKAAEKLGTRLEIEAESERCLTAIQAQLKAGDGQIIFVVNRERGAKQYEIELPGRFRVSPELAGGIKSLVGVVDVRLS
jgi:DNA polymerase III subunit alpha